MRSTIHNPYDPCDPYNPYDPLTAASFPKVEDLFRTAFRTISHSWMLGMYVICFRLQFILQFVRVEEDRKKLFLSRLHRPIFHVLKMSNYTAACIIKAVSQLLPNYESRTWDAKMRKLLSYQIVISGKIHYFQIFFSEAYSLKEFVTSVCMRKPNEKTQRNYHVMKDNSQLKVD